MPDHIKHYTENILSYISIQHTKRLMMVMIIQ
jgi:hypothetical protein